MALSFFVVIQTSYFWEGWLGVALFPTIVLLGLWFCGLLVSGLYELLLAARQRFASCARNLTAAGSLAVVALTVSFPYGLLDFERLTGPDVLVASREGAASCGTSLRLKANHIFTLRTVCFGVSQTRGAYRVQDDTVYLQPASAAPGDRDFYRFGVINQPRWSQALGAKTLVLYRSTADMVGMPLVITKNLLHP